MTQPVSISFFSIQIIANTSIASFVANYLHSKIVSTDFGTKLTCLYEALGAKKAKQFYRKLDELASSDSDDDAPVRKKVAQLRVAFGEWEEFLHRLDKQLAEIIGESQDEADVKSAFESAEEIRLAPKNRAQKGETLLSYVKSTPHNLTLLEVVLLLHSNIKLVQNSDSCVLWLTWLLRACQFLPYIYPILVCIK